jgi:ankyrin repeat protein
MCLLCGKKPKRCLVEEKKRRLLSFIQREKWDRLLSELDLTKKSANIDLRAHALSTLQELIGRNALHVVCCLHPPVAVVKAIQEICPSCVEGIDKNGYTPLHAAAEWGASPQVIDCLIHWCPEAALKKERKGKTPLHLCCENCCSEGACDTGLMGNQYVRGPLRQVINSIIKAAPQSVNEEDLEGLSPLEIAINCGADADIVRTLQRASEEAWNEAKRNKIYEEVLKRKLLINADNEQCQSLSGEPDKIVKDNGPTTQILMEYLACSKRTRLDGVKNTLCSDTDEVPFIKSTILHQMKEGFKSRWSKAA